MSSKLLVLKFAQLFFFSVQIFSDIESVGQWWDDVNSTMLWCCKDTKFSDSIYGMWQCQIAYALIQSGETKYFND